MEKRKITQHWHITRKKKRKQQKKKSQMKSSWTQVWNDAVLLNRERYELKEATVPNDVPVPARDLFEKSNQSFTSFTWNKEKEKSLPIKNIPVESRCVDSRTEWQSWRRRERTEDGTVFGKYFVVHRWRLLAAAAIVRAIACKRRHGVIVVVSEADAIGYAILSWDCKK